MHGVAGLASTLMPSVMQYKGRKFTFIGSSLLLAIGWFLAFIAMDIYTIIVSSVVLGLSSNCAAIINLVTVSEMLSPRYRSLCLTLLSVHQTIGMVLVSILGVCLNWRTVGLILCGGSLLATLLPMVWPESPSWLAYKGKFEQCEQAFVWLRGTDEVDMKELQALIAAQKVPKPNHNRSSFQRICRLIKRKDLYLPSIFMFLVLFNFYSGGGVSIYMYSKTIIEISTGDSKLAVVGYLIAVCTLLLGCGISLVMIRFFDTKTVLTRSAFGSHFFLLICCLVSYLESIGLVPKDSYLFLYFLLAFKITCNSGFNSLSFALAMELMPVKHRGVGGALFNIYTSLLYVATVKPFPFVITNLGITYTFLIFAFTSFICTILIVIYVPETKNRTLQEIEDYYNYGHFVSRNLSDAEVELPIISEKNNN
ncbi:facilitated trehalose transporter Tret1-like [Trichoplusia ni]|uniref:Facilitated trehalose transporter Tret1-like n=1 Tax=Trichoplusia ni TaxID=7111 RepID=A0A7E5W5Y1_TRINI|nr:facilitated trehalose transporter Tret1-like [Trichoplusia ni]